MIKIIYIGYFISLVIASIIAGVMGGDIVKSVGGWILTCMLLFIIIMMIDDYNVSQFCGACPMGTAIVDALSSVAVNLLIFGALAALIALIKGRS